MLQSDFDNLLYPCAFSRLSNLSDQIQDIQKELKAFYLDLQELEEKGSPDAAAAIAALEARLRSIPPQKSPEPAWFRAFLLKLYRSSRK